MARRVPHEPTAVSTLLKSVLMRLQPSQIDQIAQAQAAIDAVVPRSAINRFRLTRILGTQVEIEVDHNTLLQELRSFHQSALIQALKTVTGLEKTAKIRFRSRGDTRGSAHES